MRDLTQHLTARADDSHAAPVSAFPERHSPVSRRFAGCQIQVRFFALHRIKPHTPPLVRAPVNFFEFQPCDRTPKLKAPTSSIHRLQRGLPGYLILFATHAFVPQRQLLSRWPPSPPVFLLISTDFTPTPGIPPSPPVLKQSSFKCSSTVEPWDFTPDLPRRLRTLYAQ